MSAIGAGSGEATETSSSSSSSSNTPTAGRKFRSPTEQEIQEIQAILRQFLLTDILYRDPNPKILADYLSAHPDLDVNDVYCNFRFSSLSYNTRHYFPLHTNLYGMLMLSPIIDIDNPILKEIIRRNPHPEIVSTAYYDRETKQATKTLEEFLEDEINGNTSILNDMIQYRYPQDKIDALIRKITILRKKLEVAKKRSNPLLSSAKNLSSYMQISKNIFLKKGNVRGMTGNVEESIGSYLSGETGPVGKQMSKLRVKLGEPGVQSLQKGGKRKGKKSSKRKSTTRKNSRRS